MHYLQHLSVLMQRACRLGHKTLADGTQLFGRAPHIAPEAWLHALFPPISDYEIDQIETAVGSSIPGVFRDFLTLANGFSIFSDSLSIYGYRSNYERTPDSVWQPFSIITPNTVERPIDASESHLFIGGYPCGTGYLLYIDERDQKVSRCSRSSARPLQQWSSFPEMVVKESSRLATFFDELGRKIDPKRPVVS
jgi:hypothetical protein